MFGVSFRAWMRRAGYQNNHRVRLAAAVFPTDFICAMGTALA